MTPAGAAPRALVWFKRDLRVADHAPLAAACAAAQAGGAAAAAYVLEPEWAASPECDAQHLAFAAACIAPLRAGLQRLGVPLWLRHGPLPQVLAELHAAWPFSHLFSHEETGPGWSWQRDRRVAAWCRTQGVAWQEWPHTGVVRRLRTRNGWAGRWQARMDAPQAVAEPLPGPARHTAAALAARALPPGELPPLAALGHGPARPLPAAGEAAAQATLASFLGTADAAGRAPDAARGAHYRRDLSSPLTAEQGCSRLSAHLAFGTISMRQVHQATTARMAALRAEGTPAARELAYHLQEFAGRLRWHCHFMQKLEDEPGIEQRNFSRACDGLRPPEPDPARLAAWCEGRTGYPMVDACMRSLNATGWLNFRMRAMLVSFAAYHLWLHWREPGLHLARQFLDFEPGIHWSQMQMQSGTTGINTLRIYSPAHQAADHDPLGRFVRRWVPEAGTAAYPRPIVDERAALATAKERLYALRRTPEARAEADRIQDRHGSRKSGLPPTGRGAAVESAAGTVPRRGAAAGTRTRRAPKRGDGVTRDLFDDDPGL